MDFRLFLEISENKTILSVDDIEITIEENWLITDPHKIGDKKKFKITFRWPKTKTQHNMGNWENTTFYVSATNLNEARNTIIKWLRRKGNNKYQKHLLDLDKDLINLHAKQVSTWADLVNLVKYLAETRMSDWIRTTFFDPNDYSIFIDKARKNNIGSVLREFEPKEQKVFKLFYKKMVQDNAVPSDMKVFFDKVFRFISDTKLKQMQLLQPEEEKPQAQIQPNQSVYIEKETQKQALIEDLNTASSIQEVIKIANKFGITYKELREFHDYLYADIESHEDEYRRLHAQLTKWMWPYHHKHTKVTEGDHAAFRKWQFIIKATRTNQDWASFWGQDEGELEENLWNFYVNGPQVKPKYIYWKDALQKLLAEQENYKIPQQQQYHKAVGDEMPF
jgi:hypothetical protein